MCREKGMEKGIPVSVTKTKKTNCVVVCQY